MHAVFRDRDGLVWIGTQDGLNSFDGKNFTVYRHSDEDSSTISDQFILKITQDKKGILWIGTRNGLNSFNKNTGKFRRYYCRPEEAHTFQASYTDFIICDKDILVQRESLFIINIASGHATEIKSPGNKICSWFPRNDYSTFLINEDNRLLYCADTRKNKFIDIGTAVPLPKKEPGAYASVYFNDSTLLIYDKAGADQLYVLDPRNPTLFKKAVLPLFYSHINPLSENEIYTSTGREVLCIDIFGRIKFPLSNMAESGLPPGAILSFYRDADENLWIGTAGNGVAVTNHSFDHFRLVKTPVSEDVITSITKNSSAFFIGTRTGLYRIRDISGKISPGDFQQLMPNKIITGLAADGSGNIWAAVNGEGVLILDSNGKLIKKVAPNMLNAGNTVLSMSAGKNGLIFISTTRGFFIARAEWNKPLSFYVDDTSHPLRGNYVMSACADRRGNTWIANNCGLDVYDSLFKQRSSFASSGDSSSFIKRTIVTSVAEDKKGAVWIGTIRSGIYKYEQGKISHYTVSSGLASDVVYNLVCDEQNRIWATTGAGLDIFNEKRNDFSTMLPLDGVPAAGYVFGAVFSDAGKIYFGTSEGLLICDAAAAALHETTMQAYIAGIKVNGQAVSTDKNELEIIPDNKLISFELSVTPAFFSGNIIYQYRLSGSGEDWITLPQGIHTITYNGLAYKAMSMQVRAAGSVNNLGSAPVYSLSIKSRPPFWKTTAFVIAAALLLVLFCLLLVLLRNRKKYKEQLRKMATEKELQGERTRIGRDLHDNIGTYASALIAGLNRIRPADDEQKAHIRDLTEYGAGIMGFLRETIWLLNTETLTITAFADRFKNYTLRIAKNYPHIDFRFSEHIDHEKTLPPAQMLNLFRILQEALQNACTHSGASVITVSVNSNDVLQFEVRDNGHGFDKTEKPGHYGLGNMKARAAEAGFGFSIESDATGTVVRVLENTADASLAKLAQKR